MEQTRDRRNYTRFLVKDTIAISKRIIGPVVDISLGGMAFEYYNEDFKEIEHPTIGIYYHAESGFRISEVQYKVIWDSIVHPQTAIMPLIKKRCAVQFQEVSNEQQDNFRSFIKKYAIKKD